MEISLKDAAERADPVNRGTTILFAIMLIIQNVRRKTFRRKD